MATEPLTSSPGPAAEPTTDLEPDAAGAPVHTGRRLLRVATAGSVDDGKSTLVGRLLYDSKAVFADQLDAVADASRRRGYDETDLALLVDGLRAEREQGITIDVAYRYFSTPRRSFVLADTPGHVQYTRNMVTGASTAHVVVVLVDARAGLVDQSRRHVAIAALLGVHHVVLAVNKMDLVDYSQEVFDRIAGQFADLATRRGIASWTAVPLSALHADNVVARSDRMPWYRGPALLELLETLDLPVPPAVGARLPVQLVIRPRTAAHPDYRGYAGRVVAGTLRTGDPVTVLPGGSCTVVAGIDTADGPLTEAAAGRSVVVRLADQVDVARGDLLATEPLPASARNLRATVCWLADEPLRPGTRYRVRQTTRDVPGLVAAVHDHLDMSTLDTGPAEELVLNDIGHVTVRTAEPLPVEPYTTCRATGAFLLVDEHTGATAAAGMVEEVLEP